MLSTILNARFISSYNYIYVLNVILFDALFVFIVSVYV